jgi:hypothetical protein
MASMEVMQPLLLRLVQLDFQIIRKDTEHKTIYKHLQALEAKVTNILGVSHQVKMMHVNQPTRLPQTSVVSLGKIYIQDLAAL